MRAFSCGSLFILSQGEARERDGAVSYYTLYFTDEETLTISPGRYFKIGDIYYEFSNYDELWDAFIGFNSIH